MSTKKTLKQARHFLDQEDYEGALNCCMEALAEGPSHMAYIFLAKIYIKTGKKEECLEALSLAKDLGPDLLLTWQGFSSYYEAYPDDDKLIEIYSKLLEFKEIEESIPKMLEIVQKLGKIYENQDARLKSAQLYFQAASRCPEQEHKELLWEKVIDLYKRPPPDTAEEKQLLDEAYNSLIFHHQPKELSEKVKKHFQSYMDFLKMEGDILKALSAAQQFHEVFPESVLGLEILLKQKIEIYFETKQEVQGMEEDAIKLQNMDSESPCIDFAFGITSFLRNNHRDAIEHLNAGLEKTPGSPYHFLLLAHCLLKSYQYDEAEKCAQQSYHKAAFMEDGPQRNELLGDIWLCLAVIYAGQRCWDLCTHHLEKALKNINTTPDVLIRLATIYLKKNELEEVTKICSHLDPESPSYHQLQAEVLLCQKEYDAALEILEKLGEESAYGQHLLARLYLETGDEDEALKALIKAIKLDPYLAKNYYYLGSIYRSKQNLSDAEKCFLKGINLDANDEEIGIALTDTLLELGKEEDCLNALKYILSAASKNNKTWIFKRLGVIYFEKKNFAESGHYMKKAVQIDPNNSDCWELLGDLYIETGCLEAAAKSFKKALELKESSFYSLYRLAFILQKQLLYDQAIEFYERLVSQDPNYLPILKGLAECYYTKALGYMESCLIWRCKGFLEKSFQLLNFILSGHPSIFYFWQLYGEVCTLASQLDTSFFPLDLGEEGATATSGQSAKDILKLGERMYLHGLELEPNLGSLWYNLTVNYYKQWQKATEGDRGDLALKAFNCAKAAVRLEPERVAHWNLLGIIASLPEIQHPQLAQHSFIKAIKLDPESALSWSNLAVFYLENKGYMLSQHAMQISQIVDPHFAPSWVVKALLAELADVPLALDFFMTASQLANHEEAILGYGHQLCQVLLDPSKQESSEAFIHIGKGLFHSCEAALYKYAANHSTDAKAYVMLSLLQERMANYKAALSSSSRACLLLSQEPDSPEFELAKKNHARILWENGDSESALALLLGPDSTPISQDYGTLSFLALLAHTNNQPQEAIQWFVQALEDPALEDPVLQAHILVALALSVIKHLNTENAKPYLAKSIEHSPCSVEGLLAIYALAILDKDSELCRVTHEKLQEECGENPNYTIKIANLAAHSSAYLGDASKCTHYLTKLALENPNNIEVAKLCISHFLRLQRWDMASCLARKVHSKESATPDAMIPLALLFSTSPEKGLQVAKAAVHSHPDNLQNWLVLLSCTIPSVIQRTAPADKIYPIFKHCIYLASQKEDDIPSLLWLLLNRLWVALHLEDKENLDTFIAAAGSNDYVAFLCSYAIPKTIEAAPPSLPQNLISWLMSAHFMMMDGKYATARSLLKKSEEFAGQHHQVHWIPPIASYQALVLLQELKMASDAKAIRWNVMEKDFKNCSRNIPLSRAKAMLKVIFSFFKKNQLSFQKSLEELVYLDPSDTPLEKVARKVLHSIYSQNSDGPNLKDLENLIYWLQKGTPNIVEPVPRTKEPKSKDRSRNDTDHKPHEQAHRSKESVHRPHHPPHRSKEPAHSSQQPAHRSKGAAHKSREKVSNPKAPAHNSPETS